MKRSLFFLLIALPFCITAQSCSPDDNPLMDETEHPLPPSDSELNGEYLGWHSKNLRLVNCHITGEQPLCYARDLILENCTFGPDCDRAFEYSTLQADIRA